MKISEIKIKSDDLTNKLVDIWEKSVNATHNFLTKDEINKIKKHVPFAINNVEHLIIAATEFDEPIGFMGINKNKLEMLFITPKETGKGVGKKLLQYGMINYNLNKLTVNEQNQNAIGFYTHFGFKTYKRTDLDEEGNPYPLLYMKI